MTLRRHRSACRLLALPVDGVRYMQARTHNPLSTLVIQVFNKLPAAYEVQQCQQGTTANSGAILVPAGSHRHKLPFPGSRVLSLDPWPVSALATGSKHACQVVCKKFKKKLDKQGHPHLLEGCKAGGKKLRVTFRLVPRKERKAALTGRIFTVEKEGLSTEAAGHQTPDTRHHRYCYKVGCAKHVQRTVRTTRRLQLKRCRRGQCSATRGLCTGTELHAAVILGRGICGSRGAVRSVLYSTYLRSR